MAQAKARYRLILVLAGAAAVLRCLKGNSAAEGDEAFTLPFLGRRNNSELIETVVGSFPGARDSVIITERVLDAMLPYGMTRTNTIYGHSISRDEINYDPSHLTSLLSQYYGSHYGLGGLGGVPFAGKTGFSDFSQHVPENGHVLLVFGPHIGYTSDAEPAMFLREGQLEASAACSAFTSAFREVLGLEEISEDEDVMHRWLRDRLRRHCDAVAKSEEPMVSLVMKAYEIVEQEVFNIVNLDYGEGYLMLLGGITINMPRPLPGYFLPLHFSVRSKTTAPRDVMSAFE